MNARPRISIVTVVFNAAPIIEETVRSITVFQSDKIEYVVVDGGSKDGTLEILDRYRERIDTLVSGPDAGIYDAMNKAIDLCKGEYILNINAGDLLLVNPLEYLGDEVFARRPAFILFDVLLTDGSVVRSKKSFISRIANTFHHQGLLYRADGLLRYDLQYRVFADFDLNQRMLKSGATTIHRVPVVVCRHDIGGISHNRRHFQENFQIVRKNFGLPYVALAYLYYKFRGGRHRLKSLIR
ncbi:glycosyltransferase [Chitinophaga lutea]